MGIVENLTKRVLPNEFKFKSFDEAYMVLQEIFFLGNSQNYVEYRDLLNIIDRLGYKYQVGSNGEYRNPTPLCNELLNGFGWDNSEGIRLDRSSKYMTDPLAEQNVLYMPMPKIINKK